MFLKSNIIITRLVYAKYIIIGIHSKSLNVTDPTYLFVYINMYTYYNLISFESNNYF